MHRRFAVVLLVAAAMAAVFILPAEAAGKATHVARAYPVRGLAKSSESLRAVQKPSHVNVSWVSAATMPVAVEEIGGGAGAAGSFYVPGGYKNFSCQTGTCLNNTVQTYKKTMNAWSNDTANPIPTVPGLQPG